MKKKAGGGLGGGRSASPQMLWVSLHVLFFFCHFCLLLVFFLRDVLGSNVAVQESAGGNLKTKKAGGGCIGCLCMCCFFWLFFVFFLCFFLRDVLGSNVAATLKQKNTAGKPRFSVFFLFSFIFFVMCV